MPGVLSRVCTDVRYSLLQFYRNRQSIFFTFVFPALLFVVLGYLLEAQSGPGSIDFLLPGILGMCIFFSAMNVTMGTMVKYRTSGLFQKLTVSPMSGVEFSLSRFLTGAILVIISVAVAMSVAVIVFGVWPGINAISVLLVVEGSFISVESGMIMAYIIEDADSVNAASFTLIIPLMLLSGSLFPVERLPGLVRFLSILSPLTYLNDGLRSSMFGSTLVYTTTSPVFLVLILSFLLLILFCIDTAILMSKEGQA